MRFGELFYIHKTDRQILLLLLALATIVVCVIWLTSDYQEESQQVQEQADSVVVDSKRMHPASRTRKPIVYAEKPEEQPEHFFFDPNTADSTQLLLLGLKPWQVSNIYKYRSKGGVFRRKQDFAKLYGLTAGQYRELEPFILISSDFLPASTLEGLATDGAPGGDSLSHPVKLTEGQTVELSTADTAALKTIPGIGSFYARRIVEYGQRLGGYVSVDQLDEIEGVPAEAKTFLTLSPARVRKLRVNQASLNELKRHPYMNYYQAKAIVDYRRKHGPMSSLNDLRLLEVFTDEAMRRLELYVTFE